MSQITLHNFVVETSPTVITVGSDHGSISLHPGEIEVVLDLMGWAARILSSDVIPNKFDLGKYTAKFIEKEGVLFTNITSLEDQVGISISEAESDNFSQVLKEGLAMFQNDIKYNKASRRTGVDRSIGGPGDTFV